jgi:hypothetical protein
MRKGLVVLVLLMLAACATPPPAADAARVAQPNRGPAPSSALGAPAGYCAVDPQRDSVLKGLTDRLTARSPERSLSIDATFVDCQELQEWRSWKLPFPAIAALGHDKSRNRLNDERSQTAFIDLIQKQVAGNFQADVIDRLVADHAKRASGIRAAQSLGVVGRDERSILIGLLVSVDADGRTLPVGMILGVAFVDNMPLFTMFFRPLIEGSGSTEFDRLVQTARQDQRFRMALPS